jgi:ribosomal protein S18 acetylase RimI-like enzyme
MEILPLELDGKTGAEARRGGTRVAHVVGRLDEAESRGQHVWVGLDDHSLAPGAAPEVYADVYAEAGDPWVEQGHLTHIVVVPNDEAILRVWFQLGFGQEQVHAEAPTLAEARPAPEGVTIRQAGPADIEAVLDLAGIIVSHQVGKPVWSGVRLPDREELRQDWEEFLADETAVILLAERDDAAVGYAATYPAEEPGVAHLPVAGTRPDVRGAGVGRALAEHALHRAHTDGYRKLLADWRSTNLLASRFWPARGFVPTHIRLRRDVQPAAGPPTA